MTYNTTTNSIPEWKLSGDWFDVCKCSIPCPCEFAQTPTYGDCDDVLAYQIKKGNYGQRTQTKLMQWASNGREKVGQASIFHLNGVVLNYSFKKILS
jgi:hypothetical protein